MSYFLIIYYFIHTNDVLHAKQHCHQFIKVIFSFRDAILRCNIRTDILCLFGCLPPFDIVVVVQYSSRHIPFFGTIMQISLLLFRWYSSGNLYYLLIRHRYLWIPFSMLLANNMFSMPHVYVKFIQRWPFLKCHANGSKKQVLQQR